MLSLINLPSQCYLLITSFWWVLIMLLLVMYLSYLPQSIEAKFPCVVGHTKRTGKEIIVEKPLTYFFSLYLFHPRHWARSSWDGFLGALIVYSLTVIPMQMAFDSLLATAGNLLIFDYVIDCIFFLDVVMNFNTTFYSDFIDAYVVDRKLITEQYIKSGWFFIDCISCIPFDLVATSALGNTTNSDGSSTSATTKLIKIVRLLRLIKLAKLVNISKYLNKMEELLNISPTAVNLIMTCVQVVFISHLVCCIWWGLSSSLSSYTWYDNSGQVRHT